MPSVRKRQRIHFDTTTNYQNQRGGGGNALICSSPIPMWLHLLNGFAIAPYRTLPHCSWLLFLSHLRLSQDAQHKTDQVKAEVLQFLQLLQEPADISSIVRRETHYEPPIGLQEARDDKQRGHMAATPCMDPHTEGLTCHGHQTGAPLS